MDKIEKREMWKQRVADYKNSKKTAAAWCEDNNINKYTLRYWVQKFNNESRSTTETTDNLTSWVKVDASKPEQEIEKTSLVITVGKASITVKPNFDSECLKEVVRTLSSVC